MIRIAQNSDKEQIKNLFDKCFDEDIIFNNWFFENVFEINKTIIYETNNKITSMLQMLDYSLISNGEKYEISYIYGVCTDNEYRNQKQMAKILNYAFDLDIKKGKDFSVLIPQHDWLFDVYSKFDYKPCFKVITEKHDFNINTKVQKVKRLTHANIEDLSNVYEKALCNVDRILRDDDFWKKQIKLIDNIGLGFYGIFDNDKMTAYAFLWEIDDCLYAQEIFAIDETAKQVILQSLMKEFNKDIIRSTSFDNDFYDKFGCIKTYKKDITHFNGYMNLMFN